MTTTEAWKEYARLLPLLFKTDFSRAKGLGMSVYEKDFQLEAMPLPLSVYRCLEKMNLTTVSQVKELPLNRLEKKMGKRKLKTLLMILYDSSASIDL
jgi:hypothetical protein